jgi:hypothetical protein
VAKPTATFRKVMDKVPAMPDHLPVMTKGTTGTLVTRPSTSTWYRTHRPRHTGAEE